ncbi:MAG: YceI family protein [Bacteroidia bacterium]|nr:YceI family protein [Bacteroidia bacterium]
MKKTIFISALMFTATFLLAQKKITTSATIAFDASTILDNLPKAENKTVIAALDTKTGVVQFEASVKNFAFPNPTMQDHFNGERWMNSDQFPKFTFNGKIDDLSKINFNKDGTYIVSVSGNLTIKDVSKSLTTTARAIIEGNILNVSSSFSIKLADYNLSGGSFDSGKVSKEPKISVTAELK